MKARRCELEVRLLGYWHIGSGRGDEAAADAVIARDASGLPYLPGRTLKGLLRASMELASQCGRVEAANVQRWFGSPVAGAGQSSDNAEVEMEEGRFRTFSGALHIGSAQLSPAWRAWAAQEGAESAAAVAELTRFVASTAIDEQGTARQHTLRVREVAVPMTLIAAIDGPAQELWVEDLEAALPLLRALGSRRNRGYGRVQVSLREVK